MVPITNRLKFGGKIWIDERGACTYECYACGYKFSSSNAYECHIPMAHQHQFVQSVADTHVKARSVQQANKEKYGNGRGEWSAGPITHMENAESDRRKRYHPYGEWSDGPNTQMKYTDQNDRQIRYHPQADESRVIPKLLTCTKCQKTFTTIEFLRAHTRENHQFFCQLCPADTAKTYDTEAGLWSHQRTRHVTQFPYRCKVCVRAFKHGNQLNEHMQTVHTRGNNVKCDFCPRILMSMFEKTNHIKMYHSDRRYHCLLCKDYRTTSSVNLRRHTKEKHPGQTQPK